MSAIVDFLKSIAGICRTGALGPEFWDWDGKNAVIKVSDVPVLQLSGSAVYLTGKGLKTPVLIVRDDQGNYHGFSNRCTHIGGRKLDPVPGKSAIRCCSVSHSTFDYQGNILKGPAGKPIQVYSTEMVNGDLVIRIEN
jgi:cytochrome b6-f complex iron-sulfur subunit